MIIPALTPKCKESARNELHMKAQICNTGQRGVFISLARYPLFYQSLKMDSFN